MSNPTTPFSWQMPTATDLVTDLPADFEVFGQAVATSMADLLGGTTGQILAKASATNMDFAWIANDQGDITGVTAGTGITVTSPTGPVPTVSINTAVTADLTTAQTLTNKTLTSPVLTTPSISNINAKGDILVGTADNTLGIITAGNNGETIVADSSAATGLRYQTGYNGNAIINGGMDIFQRSSTPTTGISAPGTNAVYALDRWQLYRNTTGSTMSRQVTGDTTNLPQIQYCGRTQRTVSTSSTAAIYNSYTLETTDSIRFAGQVVTFSFYARAGANYSAASSGLVYALRSGTGTDQNNLDGFTGNTNVVSSTSTLTTTWQRFQGTATVSSTATQLGILFTFTPVGTAGANDYFEITGVQLELGSIATTFKRSGSGGGTIQQELAACQRYYEENDGNILQSATNGGLANSYGTSFTYQVTKRTTPTLTIFSGADQAGTSGSATWYLAGVGTVATADQEANQKTFFTLRRTGTATNTLFGYSFTSSAEL